MPGFSQRIEPPFTYIYARFTPGDLEAVAARLHFRLPALARDLAVDAPAQVTVLLLSADREDAFFGRLREPPARWVQGFAVPQHSLIVVRLRNLGGYPYQDAGSVAEHELVHLLLIRAAGLDSPALPRWFHEGCAMLMAREWGPSDWTRLLPAALAARLFPISALAAGFPEEEAGARLAYAQSFSFVRFLTERDGASLIGRWLARVRGGAGFAEAYRRVAGRTLAEAERDWRGEVDFLYRIVPLASSSAVFWGALSVLVVAGYIRKRRRSRDILRRWEEEEGPPRPEEPEERIH